MLRRTKIVDLLKSETTKSEVLAKGWVRTRRDAKDFSFIEINDGSCLKNLQVIAQNNLPNYNEVKSLSTGSSVAITGALVESQGGNQKYELVAEKIEIYSLAPEDFQKCDWNVVFNNDDLKGKQGLMPDWYVDNPEFPIEQYAYYLPLSQDEDALKLVCFQSGYYRSVMGQPGFQEFFRTCSKPELLQKYALSFCPERCPL